MLPISRSQGMDADLWLGDEDCQQGIEQELG